MKFLKMLFLPVALVMAASSVKADYLYISDGGGFTPIAVKLDPTADNPTAYYFDNSGKSVSKANATLRVLDDGNFNTMAGKSFNGFIFSGLVSTPSSTEASIQLSNLTTNNNVSSGAFNFKYLTSATSGNLTYDTLGISANGKSGTPVTSLWTAGSVSTYASANPTGTPPSAPVDGTNTATLTTNSSDYTVEGSGVAYGSKTTPDINVSSTSTLVSLTLSSGFQTGTNSAVSIQANAYLAPATTPEPISMGIALAGIPCMGGLVHMVRRRQKA